MAGLGERVTRAVARAAMIGSVFLAGGVTGFVAAELDVLERARDGNSAAAAAPPAVAPPAVAPPAGAAAAAPAAPRDTLAALGDVAIGPPAPATADAAPTPIPTAAELAGLRAALAVPVAGVARADLRDSFDEPRGARTHHALDVMAPRGTPVLSAADGRLLRLLRSEAGGLMVYASDPTSRFVLLYAHLDAYAPSLLEGDALRRGQPLGTVGSTGNAAADAPHLHFGVLRVGEVAEWWRGTPVNPYPLLAP